MEEYNITGVLIAYCRLVEHLQALLDCNTIKICCTTLFRSTFIPNIYCKMAIMSKRKCCFTMFNLSDCFISFNTSILSLFLPPLSVSRSGSKCWATNPQSSSQQTSCQCEIEMWENFSSPTAIDSSNKEAPTWMHFTGLMLRPSVLAGAAGSCHWRFIQPKVSKHPPSYSHIPVPSITATGWHMLTVTSWLIASLPLKQEAVTDVLYAPSSCGPMKHGWRAGNSADLFSLVVYGVYLKGLSLRKPDLQP